MNFFVCPAELCKCPKLGLLGNAFAGCKKSLQKSGKKWNKSIKSIDGTISQDKKCLVK